MNRIAKTIVLLSFIVCTLSAWGRNFVVGAELGDSTLSLAIYHVQVRMHKSKAGQLEIYWNRIDSNHYYRAAVDVPSIMELDVNHPAVLTTRVYQRNGETDSLILSYKEAIAAADQISLRLTARGQYTSLYTLASQRGKGHVVPYKSSPAGSFAAAASDHLVGTRHTLIYAATGNPPVFEGMTADSISDYIASSQDPNEGLWQHLDRDFPDRGVRLDHKYVLASISDGNGGYFLVDITNPDGPLPLKAHLTPTIFTNNYDLEWYPVKGPVQNDDCYAEITMDSHLLTINIPIHKASFRLRRIPKNTK